MKQDLIKQANNINTFLHVFFNGKCPVLCDEKIKESSRTVTFLALHKDNINYYPVSLSRAETILKRYDIDIDDLKKKNPEIENINEVVNQSEPKNTLKDETTRLVAVFQNAFNDYYKKYNNFFIHKLQFISFLLDNIHDSEIKDVEKVDDCFFQKETEINKKIKLNNQKIDSCKILLDNKKNNEVQLLLKIKEFKQENENLEIIRKIAKNEQSEAILKISKKYEYSMNEIDKKNIAPFIDLLRKKQPENEELLSYEKSIELFETAKKQLHIDYNNFIEFLVLARKSDNFQYEYSLDQIKSLEFILKKISYLDFYVESKKDYTIKDLIEAEKKRQIEFKSKETEKLRNELELLIS